MKVIVKAINITPIDINEGEETVKLAVFKIFSDSLRGFDPEAASPVETLKRFVDSLARLKYFETMGVAEEDTFECFTKNIIYIPMEKIHHSYWDDAVGFVEVSKSRWDNREKTRKYE